MGGKTIQCLPNPSQHVPTHLQQFPSYSNRKCKKSPFSRTASHIFVSPGDAPGAITLNVVWMEREFDAYKLSRWMCPYNYNRFSDRARYWSKIVIFLIPPLHSTPQLGGSRRNITTQFGVEKLEWCVYPMVKKIRRYLFVLAQLTNVTDRRTGGQTDRHRMSAIAALIQASRGEKQGRHWGLSPSLIRSIKAACSQN